MNKKIIIFCSVFFLLPACSFSSEQANPDQGFDQMYQDGSKNLDQKVQQLTTQSSDMKNTSDSQLLPPAKGDTVGIIETSLGTIKVKLFTKDAPELSKNFIELSKRGYYKGLTFHRVIKGFVIQGGDPLGDGSGGESYKGTGLADEPGALKLKHYRGALAWAKSSLPNSIGSQFYIAHQKISQLDGSYSVFGQVYEGMDVVDKIAEVKTIAEKPQEKVEIKKVTIEEVK